MKSLFCRFLLHDVIAVTAAFGAVMPLNIITCTGVCYVKDVCWVGESQIADYLSDLAEMLVQSHCLV